MNIILKKDSLDENNIFTLNEWIISDNYCPEDGWYVFIKNNGKYMWLRSSDIVKKERDKYFIKWRTEGDLPEHDNDSV